MRSFFLLIIRDRAEVSTPSPPLLSEIKGVKTFVLLNSREKSVGV